MEPALSIVALVVHCVAEELTPVVVLANCLTVAAAGNMCYMLNLVFVLIASQAGPEVTNARQRCWWEVATFIQVRCGPSRLAGALVSRWSWMRHLSALVVIRPKALVVSQMVALGVDEAVTPVVVTLALPVVRPESALRVVLADGLAVACRVDVLDVLDHVVLPLADLALVHITRRPCWAGCWHRGHCRWRHCGRCAGFWHRCSLRADGCGAIRACCGARHHGGANGGVGHGRPRALGEGGRVGTADALGAFLHKVTAGKKVALGAEVGEEVAGAGRLKLAHRLTFSSIGGVPAVSDDVGLLEGAGTLLEDSAVLLLAKS